MDLTSHSTHYRSFRRRFYGSDDPTISVIALRTIVNQLGVVNLTSLSSLKDKVKNVTKTKRPKTRRRSEDKAINQAKSKPAPT